MTILESQLETWSKQGSIAQSRDTYGNVKGVLESSEALYADRDYTVFLQGSYGNDTNIYADSDVDVVMRLNSTFYKDLSELSESEKAVFNEVYSDAEYDYAEFKRDVLAQLTKSFGSAVKPGKKAIFIQGVGARRDADVVVATKYRRYISFQSLSNENYVEGIRFLTSDGTQIINYPKLHSENCTTKHQKTSQRFKPTVRILKNMRNRMVAEGLIGEGLAPSYFLEGMLYNVPDEKFGNSRSNTFENCMNWLLTTDRSQLVCANEQFYLLNDSSPVTWRAEKCTTFLNAVADFWNKA